MSENRTYLNDEELAKLINNAEEDGVEAPASLEKMVLGRIENAEQNKKIAYRRYCFKVGIGLACAVAMLFVAPSDDNAIIVQNQIAVDKQDYIAQNSQTREEVISQFSGVRSRDEVLGRKSIAEQFSDYIFR